MRTKSAIAIAALLAASGFVAAGVTGCDYGVPASGGAAAPRQVLRCGTVVDPTGYKQGPLTADLAVALLTNTPFAAGATGWPGAGPASTEISTLDTMAVELIGHSGSKLAADAGAFAATELNYNPSGPVDAFYAPRLSSDILALQRDCPGGTRLGLRWRKGG